MATISAQVSVYPLRRAELAPTINRTLRICRERGLDVQPGPMSTVVIGDDDAVFDAIKEALRSEANEGDIVIVVTFSNACPTGERSTSPA